MQTKRKVQGLSLKRKMEVIQIMEDNPSKLLKTIADDLDIPRTTLSSIKKDKVKIKQQYNSGEQKASRFRIRGSKYDDIDCALLQWFTEQR